jgi:hypothetical protein
MLIVKIHVMQGCNTYHQGTLESHQETLCTTREPYIPRNARMQAESPGRETVTERIANIIDSDHKQK